MPVGELTREEALARFKAPGLSKTLSREEALARFSDAELPGTPSPLRSAVGGLLGGVAGGIDALDAVAQNMGGRGDALSVQTNPDAYYLDMPPQAPPKENILTDLAANVRGARQLVQPPEERGRGNLLTEGVPETLMQMAPGIAAGAINPLAGAVVFGAQSGGPAYFEVVGAGGSPEEGMLALVGNAGLAQLERVGAGGMFTKALKKLGGSQLGKRTLGQIAARLTVGSAKETGTEGLEQLGHDLIHAGLTGEEVAILDNLLATVKSPTVWTVGALGAGAEAAAGRQTAQNAPGAKQPTRMAAHRPTEPMGPGGVQAQPTQQPVAPAGPGLPSGEVPMLGEGGERGLSFPSDRQEARRDAQIAAGGINLPLQMPPAQGQVAQPKPKSRREELAGRRPHELTADEAEEALTLEREHVKNADVLALGEEGAKEWRNLQRAANSAIPSERSDQASRRIAEIEAGLTEEQNRLLFGIGETGMNEETLRELADGLRDVHSAADEAELGRIVGLSLVNASDADPATVEPSSREALALAKLAEAKRLIEERGLDSEAVTRAALERATEVYGDDAPEMLRRWLPGAAPKSVAPPPVETPPVQEPVAEKPAPAPEPPPPTEPTAKPEVKAKAKKQKDLPAPPTMTARQINKELDKLEVEDSKLTDALIAAGRGSERPTDRASKTDQISVRSREISHRMWELREEAKARYGPNLIGHLPARGFGPRATPEAMAEMAEDREAILAAQKEKEAQAKAKPEPSTTADRASEKWEKIKRGERVAVSPEELGQIESRFAEDEDIGRLASVGLSAKSFEAYLVKPKPGGVTEMFAGGPNPFGKFSNVSTAKFKKWAKKWLTSAGDRPRDVRREMELAEGASQAEMIEVSRHAKRLDAAMRAVDPNWRATDTAERVDAAFEGDKAALASLPEEAQAAVADMRAQLDRVIRSQVKAGGVIDPKTAPDFAKKILESQGSYSRRMYKAYLDPEWADKVPADVRQRTHDLFRSWKEYAGATDAEIDAELDSILQSAKEATANPWKAIAAGKLGRKDLSLYKRRKDIPAELRAFLGEVKDPIANYATSVFKIAQNVARHEASVNIKKMGLGKFLFEKPTGDAVAKLSSEGNKALAPLDGLYVTPELKAALVEIGPAEMPAIIKAAARVNGAIKWGKVIGQPWAFMRNLWGNVPMSIANGHLPSYFKSKEWKAAFGEGDLDMLKRLKHLGIIDDNISTYEWEDAKRTAKATPEEIAKGVLAPGQAGKAIRGAERLFQAADNAPKIRFFFAEKASLVEAGYSPAEAESLAADRTRDLMPTPERMPEVLKRFRRQPLLGTFFAFRAEVVRTTANRLRLISTELKSGNPKVRAMGQRRAAGQIVAATMTPALAYAVNMLNGVDAGEDEDKRNFLPPWDKNSRVVWTGSEAEGEYFDLSDLDPFTMGSDPVMRILAGADPVKAIEGFVREELEAFVGPSIITRLGIDIATGKKRDGAPIDDMAAHILKTVEPGIASSARRVPETGLLGELGAMASGVRRYGFDVQKSLGHDVARYSRLQAEAKSKEGRQSKRDPDDKKQNVEALEVTREEAFDEMAEKAQAALRLGVPPQEVRKILRESVSQKEANAIIGGTYRPHKDTKKALRE